MLVVLLLAGGGDDDSGNGGSGNGGSGNGVLAGYRHRYWITLKGICENFKILNNFFNFIFQGCEDK